MNHNEHQNIVGFIWNIANKLRGPYRPPQYRKVMLPLVVLRRLDLVLEPTKAKVLAEKAKLEAKGIKDAALDKALSRVAVGADRSQAWERHRIGVANRLARARARALLGRHRHLRILNTGPSAQKAA